MRIGTFLGIAGLLFVGTLLLYTLTAAFQAYRAVETRPLSSCGAPLARRSFPLSLVAAVLAQEDHAFLSHRGINWREVRQAFRVNLRSGKVLYGASTIDMQVADLCFRDGAMRSKWQQKLREVLLVWLLHQKYSKAEILRAYLTAAPLGEGVSGFEEAARHYFNKPLMKLNFQEEWSLVLTLRNKDSLNPHSTKLLRHLPRKIRKQWLAAVWRQRQTLAHQKYRLLLLPYARNKDVSQHGSILSRGDKPQQITAR